MLTLYARKVPTDDAVLFKYAAPADIDLQGVHRDVLISRPDGTEVCRIPWHRKSKPDRRNRYFTLNCNRYRLIWTNYDRYRNIVHWARKRYNHCTHGGAK